MQSEPGKRGKKPKGFWNLSDFELKFSQPVGIWFEVFTTGQILDWKKYHALDFEYKIFNMSDFEKCLHPKNHV